MLSDNIDALIQIAIEEDVGFGDITTQTLIDESAIGSAKMVAREELVVCGVEVAKKVFSYFDSALEFEVTLVDGCHAECGEEIAVLQGRYRSILTIERLALNFLQRLSGIATLTSKLAKIVTGEKVQLLDTRKTTPGWRELEKYAVLVGGGTNHRHGLYDAFLIKNNHVDALAGGVKQAVLACRKRSEDEGRGVKVEVEVRDDVELREALEVCPDAILLDNMSPDELRDAVAVVEKSGLREQIELEASGGIKEENLVEYATTGVDALSLGLLTHSARAVDIALRYVGI